MHITGTQTQHFNCKYNSIVIVKCQIIKANLTRYFWNPFQNTYCLLFFSSNFPNSEGDRDKQGIGIQAADLLLSTRHLVSMSALPALCNIICISLEHLLLHVKSTELDKMSEGTERKTKNEKDRVEQMQREERKPGNEERVENESPPLVGKSRHLSIQDHIPFTLTQVCLTVLGSFLRHDAKKDKR